MNIFEPRFERLDVWEKKERKKERRRILSNEFVYLYKFSTQLPNVWFRIWNFPTAGWVINSFNLVDYDIFKTVLYNSNLFKWV